MNPSPSTVQKPTHSLPRWLLGRIGGMFKFAFHHPIEAVLLAILLWIALVGLTNAHWSAAPQNGIAQTALAGEQQSFQDTLGVHVPALVKWAFQRLGDAIDITSYAAATWMAKFTHYFMAQVNAPAPAAATAPVPTPHHK